MKFVSHWLRQVFERVSLEPMANEVVIQLEEAVWSLVTERAPVLEGHDFRGYVRARASVVVRGAIDLRVYDGLSPRRRAEFASQINQKMLIKMVDRLQAARPSLLRHHQAA